VECSRRFARTSDGLRQNKGAARRLPALSGPVEQALCHRWFEDHDIAAAARLVTAHLGIVGSIAAEYGNCQLTPQDLAGEGYVGLMRALCRYDPACDMAFTTYATKCIRAEIQRSLLRSEALIKVAGAARRCRRSRNRAGSGNGEAAVNPWPAYVSSVRRDAAVLVVSQHRAG
jgi:DNA-directed RNA polymerase sigma subunit (sigma70/sigma32)